MPVNFRRNKKSKDDPEKHQGRSLTSTLKSKKNKKHAPQEEKPSVDLAQALPSDDDFRTSLIMPKLSARFSMLREQDDPATKVGKASDDSVIHPKRGSRMDALGLASTQLADIAEVDSVCGRSSYARAHPDSTSNFGTEDDRFQPGSSVIDRPRPYEGNNLFGGRQKVFKIPAKQLGPNGETGRSGMSGRAFYEGDLPLSAFQRIRLDEKKEAREARAKDAPESAREDTTAPEPEEAASSASANRTTYSSMASGPSNSGISTTATSVDGNESQHNSSDGQASGSMPRSTSSLKSRRLYNQGLAQSAQDQQSSTLQRLESLSRQRAGIPETHTLDRSLSRSSPSLRDRLHTLATSESANASQPSSPSLSATSNNAHSREDDPKEMQSQSATSSLGGTSPLGPPVPDDEKSNENTALVTALNPEDRGKATAMGLFNKPQTAFDEFQFMHRQIKLRQSTQPPSSKRNSPGGLSAQSQSGRPRRSSVTSSRSGAASAASHRSETQHTTHQPASNTEKAAPQAEQGTSFFGNSSDSESRNDDAEDQRSAKVNSTASQDSQGMRPGYQSGSSTKSPAPPRDSQDRLPEVRFSELADLKPIAEDERPQGSDPSSEAPLADKPDSPTLGPVGPNLSGLVNSHLRQDSDVLPPSDANFAFPEPRDLEGLKNSPPQENSMPHKPMNQSTENLDSRQSGTHDSSTTAPPPRRRPTIPNIQTNPQKVRKQSSTHIRQEKENQSALQSPVDFQDAPENPPVEDKLVDFRHRRAGSTETQRERMEFAHELAERRRKVEEKLKSISETESRSGSPVPGSRSSSEHHVRPGNAFSILKNKPGFMSPSSPGRQQVRNLRALGLGSENASTPTLNSDQLWKFEEDGMPYGIGKHSNSSTPHLPARSRAPTTFSHGSQEEQYDRSQSLDRVMSPSLSYRAEQERSFSEASGRFKSHSRYQNMEDLQPLEEVGYDNDWANSDYQEQRSLHSMVSSARPSGELHNQEQMREFYAPRSRSGSRPTTMSSQFERPSYPTRLCNSPVADFSPRPSPIPSYCANTTPPLHDLPLDPHSRAQSSHSNSSADNPNQRTGLTKRAVSKMQISEPTFVHTTSSVPVVGLPPGTKLNSAQPPPVPPMNPRRRRQTTAQNFFGNFKKDKHDTRHTVFNTDYIEDQSIFSDDDDKKSRMKHKVRKIPSEGGHLNQRAARPDGLPRPFYTSHPPPPLPQGVSRQPHSHYIPMEGGMI